MVFWKPGNVELTTVRAANLDGIFSDVVCSMTVVALNIEEVDHDYHKFFNLNILVMVSTIA